MQEWMPEGWATLISWPAAEREVASPTAPAALPAAGRVWVTLSRVVVQSTGHERPPYLSRMCSSMASVVAHLTRVRSKAEGARDQDRQGPGRIRAIPPHRTRDVQRAAW